MRMVGLGQGAASVSQKGYPAGLEGGGPRGPPVLAGPCTCSVQPALQLGAPTTPDVPTASASRSAARRPWGSRA